MIKAGFLRKSLAKKDKYIFEKIDLKNTPHLY
jgi:hypothetical protein